VLSPICVRLFPRWFPPHRRGIGRASYGGPIGGTDIAWGACGWGGRDRGGCDWGGCWHGRPDEPPDFGESAVIRAAHQQTHHYITGGPQVGNAADTEMLRRQFVVHLERSICDFERTAAALLDDTGVVVPVDAQLACHI
jgi:hypothetical protein